MIRVWERPLIFPVLRLYSCTTTMPWVIQTQKYKTLSCFFRRLKFSIFPPAMQTTSAVMLSWNQFYILTGNGNLLVYPPHCFDSCRGLWSSILARAKSRTAKIGCPIWLTRTRHKASNAFENYSIYWTFHSSAFLLHLCIFLSKLLLIVLRELYFLYLILDVFYFEGNLAV